DRRGEEGSLRLDPGRGRAARGPAPRTAAPSQDVLEPRARATGPLPHPLESLSHRAAGERGGGRVVERGETNARALVRGPFLPLDRGSQRAGVRRARVGARALRGRRTDAGTA